jgi:hypothetical protein
MKVNLHSGTGSARNITGIGFQPDFTIVKRRDNTGVWYNTDIVRGAGKQMYLNETGGMGSSVSTHEITGFNSDGFNLGTDAGVNASGGTYASYNFLANNTTGSSNTDGNITSTVSVNTTAGFSIVKYTGNSGGSGYSATIGHGLGVTPKFIIVKCISQAGEWNVYANDATDFLKLNESNATADDNTKWYDTAPSNAVFTVGTNSDVNNVGRDYIAYCFAEKTGYSKIGSYTGNGSADGTFVYTGFKPAFMMIKITSGASNWRIFDNKRIGYNVDNNPLYPNVNNAEGTEDNIDILSNGFKWRTTDGALNGSGSSYIFMAFASAPLVGTNNVPCTAR